MESWLIWVVVIATGVVVVMLLKRFGVIQFDLFGRGQEGTDRGAGPTTPAPPGPPQETAPEPVENRPPAFPPTRKPKPVTELPDGRVIPADSAPTGAAIEPRPVPPPLPSPVDPRSGGTRLAPLPDEPGRYRLDVFGVTRRDGTPAAGLVAIATVGGEELANGTMDADGGWSAEVETEPWMDDRQVVLRVGGIALKRTALIALPGDEDVPRPEIAPPGGTVTVNGSRLVAGERVVIDPVLNGDKLVITYDLHHARTDRRASLIVDGHGVEIEPSRPGVDGVIFDHPHPDYASYVVAQPQTFHEAGGDTVSVRVRTVEKVDNDPRTVSITFVPPSGDIMRARVPVEG